MLAGNNQGSPAGLLSWTDCITCLVHLFYLLDPVLVPVGFSLPAQTECRTPYSAWETPYRAKQARNSGYCAFSIAIARGKRMLFSK
jgi:hypothetical protein